MKIQLHRFGVISFALGLAGAFAFNDLNAASVFPIATSSGDETALSLAFDGTNYLVGIMGDEIADTNGNYLNVTAQLVSQPGALVGSRIKVGRTGDIPSVAFDGTNYLLIWKDSTEDIYGQRVSRSGALVGGAFAISTAFGEQKPKSFPPVAFGGGNYLVVWQDGRAGAAIYGQLVSPSGTLVGPEIAIDTDLSGAHGGSVGFDGTKFLVVWQKRNNASQEQHDTYGVFVTPSGTRGTPFMISQTSSASYNPLHLFFNGTNYFVIWNKDTGLGSPSPSDFDIYGRFVSPAGSFSGNEMALVTGTNDQVMPGVSFDGANYLLTWTDGPFGGSNTVVKFQFLDPAGQASGPPFAPFAGQATNSPFFAEALFDGSRFAAIATFTSGDVYGTFIPRSTAPPRLDGAGPLVDAQYPLLLTGTPGVNYTIQTITNLGLSNWMTLVTNSPATGTFNFTDTQATNANRFYRAVKQ